MIKAAADSEEAKRFTFPVLGRFMVRGSAKATAVIEVIDSALEASSMPRLPKTLKRSIGNQLHRAAILDALSEWKALPFRSLEAPENPEHGMHMIAATSTLFPHAPTWMIQNRQVFVVVGPPGHGKTLLSEDIMHQLLMPGYFNPDHFTLLTASSSIPVHSAHVAFGSMRGAILDTATSVCKDTVCTAESVLGPELALETAGTALGMDPRYGIATAVTLGVNGSASQVYQQNAGWAYQISAKDRTDIVIATSIAMLHHGTRSGRRYVLVVDDFQVCIL